MRKGYLKDADTLTKMADYLAAVRLHEGDFVSLVQGVEDAFARGGAALVGDARLQLRWIEIIDADDIFSSEEWERFEEIIINLDYLVYFAFGRPSDDTIRAWATQLEPELSDQTISRVEVMRELMPTLEGIYSFKVRSVVPMLNVPDYQVQFAHDAEEPHVDLLVSASLTDSLGVVDRRGTQRLLMRLLPSDIAFLQDTLSDIMNDMAALQGDLPDESDEDLDEQA